MSSSPASTYIVTSLAWPDITYTPSDVIVISSPSLRLYFSAEVRSAVCSKSLSVNISVASIIPSDVTFAVVSIELLLSSSEASLIASPELSTISVELELLSLLSSLETLLDFFENASSSSSSVDSADTSFTLESFVLSTLPQAANALIIIRDTNIILTFFLIALSS